MSLEVTAGASAAGPDTIDGVRDSIRSGTITASTLAAQCFARIEAHDPTINAWLNLGRDRALAQAAKIDHLAARDRKSVV